MALADLDEGIGVEINGCRINNLAYADDVILLASTPEGLQSQMDALVNNLESGGLRISAGADGKSARMRVVVDGKAKKWVVDPTPFLLAGEQVIPTLPVTGEYKYLGIQVPTTGSNMKVKEGVGPGSEKFNGSTVEAATAAVFTEYILIAQVL